MTERCQGRISFFVGIRLFVIEKPPTDADVHTNTILTPLLSFRARRLPSPEKQSLDRDRHRLRWRRRRRRESRRWPWERSCPRCRFVPHGEFQTLSRRHLNLTPSKIDSSPDDMLKTNGNARRSDALVPTPCFHCSPGHLVHAAKTMAQARSTRADWGDLPLSSPLPPANVFAGSRSAGSKPVMPVLLLVTVSCVPILGRRFFFRPRPLVRTTRLDWPARRRCARILPVSFCPFYCKEIGGNY